MKDLFLLFAVICVGVLGIIDTAILHCSIRHSMLYNAILCLIGALNEQVRLVFLLTDKLDKLYEYIFKNMVTK